MYDQPVEQCAAFFRRHSDDFPGVRGQVQRLAGVLRNRAHEHLRHRRQRVALLLREVGEPQPGTRSEDGMDGHQAVEARLRFGIERVVRRAQVGELGVAADRCDRTRIEQRRARRQVLERAVGMPQPVAQLEHAQAAVRVPDLVVGVQVGDIGDLGAHAQRRIGPIHADRRLERAEEFRERQVLVDAQVLVGKHQDRVLPERLAQRVGRGGVHGCRQVDVADLGGEAVRDRLDGDAHAGLLADGFPL